MWHWRPDFLWQGGPSQWSSSLIQPSCVPINVTYNFPYFIPFVPYCVWPPLFPFFPPFLFHNGLEGVKARFRKQIFPHAHPRLVAVLTRVQWRWKVTLKILIVTSIIAFLPSSVTHIYIYIYSKFLYCIRLFSLLTFGDGLFFKF